MAKADGYIIIDTKINTSGLDNLEADLLKAINSIAAASEKMAAEINDIFSKVKTPKNFFIKKSDIEIPNVNNSKQLQQIDGQLGGIKAKLGKLGGAITAAFSVAAITRFASECIELGSALEEVQNVADVSFGGISDRMEEFASSAITQFGMSELAAKQTGSTYMAMAKGLGVAQDAAADMSLELTGLSGDVASFYNLNQETAARKLQGIFTGESEALKELGVVMTQTNLKQYALSHGMNANIEAMSQAELVALRYAFVTDALSLASGDFARTQNSWANQTRILSMQWQQFMSEIGSTLTTVLLPVVKVLNTIIGKLIEIAKSIRTVANELFGTGSDAAAEVAQQNQAVVESASAGASAENDLADATAKAGKEAKKALAGFDELNKVQSQAQSGTSIPASSDYSVGSGTAISGGTVIVGGTVEDKLSPKIQAIVDRVLRIIEPLRQIDFSPLLGAFSRLKKALEPITSTLFDGLEWAYYNILVPIAKWTIEDALPTFLDVLSGALDVLNSTIDALKPLGKWLWDKFLQPIAKWTGSAIISALNGVSDALSAISDWISENQEIVEVFAIVVGSFAAAWGLVNGAITAWKAISAAATTVTTAFGAAVNAISWPVVAAVAAIGALIAIVVLLVQNWDAVKAAAEKAWAGIKNAWNAVAGWFDKNIIQPVSRFFSNMWTGFVDGAKAAWEGVKSVFGAVAGFFGKIFRDAWAKVVSVFSTAGEIFVDIKDGILTAFKAIVNGIIKGINSIVAIPFNGINSALSGIRDIDIMGLEPFSWIPTIPVPQIPYLAKGAVIPPRAPFAAILGDQRSGTNIEAPLSTIQEAVALVMDEYAASNLAGQEATIAVLRDILQAVLGIEIGDRVIGEAAQRYSAKMAVVRGG